MRNGHNTRTPDTRCRRCVPTVLQIPPKGWTREDWEWVHQAPDPDPDRWTDASTLLASPAGRVNFVEKLHDDSDLDEIGDAEEVRLDEALPTARAENAKARAENAKARAAGVPADDDIILNSANPIRTARALLDANSKGGMKS